jgi:hypothetical protein
MSACRVKSGETEGCVAVFVKRLIRNIVLIEQLSELVQSHPMFRL